MSPQTLLLYAAFLATISSTLLPAQEPASDLTPAAVAGSKQDSAAVSRGAKVFATYCAGCHGAAAKGGPGAPDLIRSLVVLDDEKGLLIGPVIREGRPDKGMPKLNLKEDQIADVVAWLHVKTYAAGHRGTYVFQDVLTGNAAKGQAYFNAAGRCNTCHSPTGDLAGIGRKYDPFSLQGRWLQPPKRASAVTVTLASGQSFTGSLNYFDDFTVAMSDANGVFHSFARETPTSPAIEIRDPLKAHTELLRTYSDADIHNVTAYLVTLK